MMDKLLITNALTKRATGRTAKHSLLLVVLAFLLTPLAGCSHSGETSAYEPVDASGWNYGDTIGLVLESPDSVAAGDLAIAVRHSADYDYSNIWLEVSYPIGDSIKSDTVNVALADVYGNWFGKGLGLSYQHVDTVLRDINLRLPARIGIRHIMRVDKIKGIEQLGIIIAR